MLLNVIPKSDTCDIIKIDFIIESLVEVTASDSLVVEIGLANSCDWAKDLFEIIRNIWKKIKDKVNKIFATMDTIEVMMIYNKLKKPIIQHKIKIIKFVFKNENVF